VSIKKNVASPANTKSAAPEVDLFASTEPDFFTSAPTTNSGGFDPFAAAPVAAPVTAPASVNNSIELIQLAQIVKDYGVNITVSVTSTGTEVKMSK
jgi:hypothetical protein